MPQILETNLEDQVEGQPEIPWDSIAADPPAKSSQISTESTFVTDGGRRRGRRKVMKKKTIKDDEGYLGTQSAPSKHIILILETDDGQ